MPLDEAVPALTPEILALTPQQATAKLVEMQIATHPPPTLPVTDAQGARQMLDKLTADPTWAKALLNGDATVAKQFVDLTKLSADGDDIGDAIVGTVEPVQPVFETTTGGALPRRDIATAVAGFREVGLNDASIQQALNGGTVSLAEFKAAETCRPCCKPTRLGARGYCPATIRQNGSGRFCVSF
jgi:hypothetical protein